MRWSRKHEFISHCPLDKLSDIEMNKCFFGDNRDTMRKLIDDGVKVQMCVTSPPYFGLRDYGHDGQLGLEETPEQYIANMVDVFRLVKDLLADDGVLWLNIGDSYNGSGKGVAGITSRLGNVVANAQATNRLTKVDGLKPKDLIGIPWMLAFALRTDGWYLRQDIIWHKPNPMPESVTDRCTKSHEYIFLLSKSERYYFDNSAIKEPAAPSSISRWNQDIESQVGSDRVPGKTNGNMSSRDSFKRIGSKRGIADVCPASPMPTHREDRAESEYDVNTRNKRSVWTVATVPYSGAHFATFPPALIEPPILAGSRVGDILIDPFFGSGTVGEVAQNLGRQWIGCELNTDYKPLQDRRTEQLGLALA